MRYIEGTNRDQLSLFENKLDEIISEDHVVRFIDAYVDKLDLEKIGIKNIDEKKGRPGYSPYLYLKIYIFSYLNRTRSSRKIERECKRNIELIWLTEQLSPDHWSISNFRKENKEALKNIFKEFLNFCYKLKLLSFECIAVDGTKMRALNNNGNVYKKENLGKLEVKIEQKINEYMEGLENEDEKDKDEYEFLNKNIPKKIKQLMNHKEKLEEIKKIFDENPDIERYYANDPDCRFQKDNGRYITGYNCQTAVDEKHKLIISTDITNDNHDHHQINNMKDRVSEVKKEMNDNKKTVLVADAGYYAESEIIRFLEDYNYDVYIPHPNDLAKRRDYKKGKKIPSQGYEKNDFKYDSQNDVFICPEGQLLIKIGSGTISRRIKKINYRCKSCNNCEKRDLCTRNKRGRELEVFEKHLEMKQFNEKVNSKTGKRIIEKRKEIVEHPFGTIKRNLGYSYFMQTGFDNVKAEFSFIAFIYNLKRVMNIIGVKDLIKALN